MSLKKIFVLSLIGMTFSAPLYAKSFFEQILESAVTGSSNSNSNGSGVYKELSDREQTLREDQQRLDEAYSQLRQKQAAGQDVTADLENIKMLERTLVDRTQQVRQLRYQADQVNRQQQFSQRQAAQQQQMQLDDAYYQLRQKQAQGLDTTQDIQNIRYLERQISNQQRDYGNNTRRNSFGNSWDEDSYGNGRWQDEDSNDGFRFSFGG